MISEPSRSEGTVAQSVTVARLPQMGTSSSDSLLLFPVLFLLNLLNIDIAFERQLN